MINITLYTTGCPKCKVLERKLNEKDIPYTVVNSIDEMVALGLSEAPALRVDDKLMTFAEAVEWLRG